MGLPKTPPSARVGVVRTGAVQGEGTHPVRTTSQNNSHTKPGISMTVSLEELQKFIDKEAIIHLIQDDGTTKEITATIKAATVAGVPFKEKGKAGLEFATVEKFYEIAPAPVKAKTIAQKALNPIELGQARAHLVDRHGVQLSWAKDADEQSAFDYHASLDHADLGHRHYTESELAERKAKAEKDEREKALASG